VSGKLEVPCGKLPIPVLTCPTCGDGIKPSRGWTWINPKKLIMHSIQKKCFTGTCHLCPIQFIYDGCIELTGLIWIGEKFYPTPEDYLNECREVGISRRIRTVPKGLVVGETYVLLAHRKVLDPVFKKEIGLTRGPAIFSVFRPTKIEVICEGAEDEEVIKGYEKRGLTPVIVKPKDDLFGDGEEK